MDFQVNLVFLFSLVCSIHSSYGGEFIVKPSNTYSAQDATTRFLCKVNRQTNEEVYWKFNPKSGNNEDFATIGPFSNRNPALDRYTITGNAEHDIYNLEISGTTMGDEGDYTCLIVQGTSSTGTTANMTVTVQSPPSSPAICTNVNVNASGVAGEIATLTCSIVGGIPLPFLQIVRIQNGQTVKLAIPSETAINDASPYPTITETATFTLSHLDHMAQYACLAFFPTVMEEYREVNCEYMISPTVRFPPILRIDPQDISVDGDDDTETIVLTCNVNAYPPTTGDVVWQYDTIIFTKVKVDGDTLTLEGVYETYIGKKITCTSTNAEGDGIATITIKETDDILPFETFILLIIIAAACLVLFIFTCCIILCCCGNETDTTEGEKHIRYEVNESRPTSMRQDGGNGDDIIDGYENGTFEGGAESNIGREQSRKSNKSYVSNANSDQYSENRSSKRSNDYNDVNTFDNSAYAPDDNDNGDLQHPLY